MRCSVSTFVKFEEAIKEKMKWSDLSEVACTGTFDIYIINICQI